VRVVGYRPSNNWLQRQVDRRWRAWLTRCLGGAVVVGVTLAAVIGPRQENVRLRYEIATLAQDVARLEREHRRLQIERETLTAPAALQASLDELGLQPVAADRLAFLTADGRLVVPPTPTPAAVAARPEARR
jgi:cell division protein FtsL